MEDKGKEEMMKFSGLTEEEAIKKCIDRFKKAKEDITASEDFSERHKEIMFDIYDFLIVLTEKYKIINAIVSANVPDEGQDIVQFDSGYMLNLGGMSPASTGRVIEFLLKTVPEDISYALILSCIREKVKETSMNAMLAQVPESTMN